MPKIRSTPVPLVTPDGNRTHPNRYHLTCAIPYFPRPGRLHEVPREQRVGAKASQPGLSGGHLLATVVPAHLPPRSANPCAFRHQKRRGPPGVRWAVIAERAVLSEEVGGGGGNRTPVPRRFRVSFYRNSSPFGSRPLGSGERDPRGPAPCLLSRPCPGARLGRYPLL